MLENDKIQEIIDRNLRLFEINMDINGNIDIYKLTMKEAYTLFDLGKITFGQLVIVARIAKG